MRSLIITLTLISFGFLTSGCNTMEGMGKDIKKGGKNLEEAADRHK